MNRLEEHRQFRNQMIICTILLFAFGGFMLIPFEFLSKDASDKGYTLIGFGVVLGLIICTIFILTSKM